MYTCRGDKTRDMDIYMYLEKVRPYLIALIDETKTSDQNIKASHRTNS